MTREDYGKIKLHLLNSLARSQRAVARILECAADHAEQSDEFAKKIKQHIHFIETYQRILTLKMTRLMPGKVQRCPPGKPWVNREKNVLVCYK